VAVRPSLPPFRTLAASLRPHCQLLGKSGLGSSMLHAGQQTLTHRALMASRLEIFMAGFRQNVQHEIANRSTKIGCSWSGGLREVCCAIT
jgi:hypothetical protein